MTQSGDVLNVGFGLGIVDEAIQRHAPRSHTIIEAHPDVYKHMMEQGWGQKEGVRVVFGRWQDVVQEVRWDPGAGSARPAGGHDFWAFAGVQPSHRFWGETLGLQPWLLTRGDSLPAVGAV